MVDELAVGGEEQFEGAICSADDGGGVPVGGFGWDMPVDVNDVFGDQVRLVLDELADDLGAVQERFERGGVGAGEPEVQARAEVNGVGEGEVGGVAQRERVIERLRGGEVGVGCQDQVHIAARRAVGLCGAARDRGGGGGGAFGRRDVGSLGRRLVAMEVVSGGEGGGD